MKEVLHTKANGTLPFDHHFGVGFEVGHEGWSPYERVNKLREKWGSLPWNIDTTRLKLVTESYQAHENESYTMKVAYAFEHIISNMPLTVYDDELIVGEIAASAKEAPLFPEYSAAWIIDEILNHPFEERTNDQFYIKSEEDRQLILDSCKWWIGKTVNSLVEENYTPEMKRGNEYGGQIAISTDYRFGGIGHTAIDYRRPLLIGFDGLIKEVEDAKSKLSESDSSYNDKFEEYEAMLIMLKAAKAYINRFGEFIAEKAETEQDETRQAELKTMAENCFQIAGGPAKTYWQALQLFNFVTTLIEIEANGQSISYGRFDQWLDPFLQEDLKNNVINKDFAQELLEVLFVKLNNQTKLKDFETMEERNGRGYGGESMTVGGIDVDGNDATNDTTMMVLDASAHTRMLAPWTALRVHDGTPYELKVKVAEVIRCGFGHPKLFNDHPTIETYNEKGATLEEARNYSVVGCVEPSLEGLEYSWAAAGMINAAKVCELALHHGRLMDGDVQIGPDAGGYDTFETFEEVLEAVDTQFAYATNLVRICNDVLDRAHQARKPVPFLSTMFHDPIANGLDLSKGGAKYNGTGPETTGVATVADTLTTIKQLVFDQKTHTLKELAEATHNNWKGYEKLYALVNSSKVHHYGNDDPYADEIFNFVFRSICENMKEGNKYNTHPRGGRYNPGVYSVNANVSMGHHTRASIDGRKDYEPISENICPVHTAAGSHDILGPTAVLNSVASVDHSLATNGTLLNIRFPEDVVRDVKGRDNLLAYIQEIINTRVMHCQFNIMSAETMKKAQKKPEEYQDMLVRVAGYSAYFVELGKGLQNDIIGRSEFNFG